MTDKAKRKHKPTKFKLLAFLVRYDFILTLIVIHITYLVSDRPFSTRILPDLLVLVFLLLVLLSFAFRTGVEYGQREKTKDGRNTVVIVILGISFIFVVNVFLMILHQRILYPELIIPTLLIGILLPIAFHSGIRYVLAYQPFSNFQTSIKTPASWILYLIFPIAMIYNIHSTVFVDLGVFVSYFIVIYMLISGIRYAILARKVSAIMLVLLCFCSIAPMNSLYQQRPLYCSSPRTTIRLEPGRVIAWESSYTDLVYCTYHPSGCWYSYIKIKHIPLTIYADWFEQLSPNQYMPCG